MTRSRSLTAFSYGLHFEETVRALKAAATAETIDDRVACIARALPQAAASTRGRLAQKIVQRYFPEGMTDSPFLRLVRGLSQSQMRRELLYWKLSRTDALVGALARGLFYPYFIQRKPPAGLTMEEFRVMNGAALLPVRPVIVAGFAEVYAARAWDFHHPTVVQRALHVLEEASIVRKRRLTELRGHPVGYDVAPRDLSLPAFLYCLHDEFGASKARPIALRRLARSRFARTFVLWPEQIHHLAAAAARHRFLTVRRSKTSTAIQLRTFSLDKLVATMLARFGSE